MEVQSYMSSSAEVIHIEFKYIASDVQESNDAKKKHYQNKLMPTATIN